MLFTSTQHPRQLVQRHGDRPVVDNKMCLMAGTEWMATFAEKINQGWSLSGLSLINLDQQPLSAPEFYEIQPSELANALINLDHNLSGGRLQSIF